MINIVKLGPSPCYTRIATPDVSESLVVIKMIGCAGESA